MQESIGKLRIVPCAKSFICGCATFWRSTAQKNERQKKAGLLNWEDRSDVSRLTWTAKPEHKDSDCHTPSLRVRQGLDWSGRSDVERGMAVANALGRRGSNCATAAQLKSPMMAWGTCGRFYFYAANDQRIDCPFASYRVPCDASSTSVGMP